MYVLMRMCVHVLKVGECVRECIRAAHVSLCVMTHVHVWVYVCVCTSAWVCACICARVHVHEDRWHWTRQSINQHFHCPSQLPLCPALPATSSNGTGSDRCPSTSQVYVYARARASGYLCLCSSLCPCLCVIFYMGMCV